MPNPSLLITQKELAKRLCISIPTLANYVRKGVIPGPIAGTQRYSWPAVEEALKLSRLSAWKLTEAEAAERAFDEDVMRHG